MQPKTERPNSSFSPKPLLVKALSISFLLVSICGCSTSLRPTTISDTPGQPRSAEDTAYFNKILSKSRLPENSRLPEREIK